MKHILIIGNSASGISCAQSIRKKDRAAKITIISDEDYTGYHRCLISYYLAGDIKENQLIYRDKNFYNENNIDLLLNKKASRIDTKKTQVVLEDKTRIDYDALLIACGAVPKFPEIKGIQKKGVFGFRTIADAKNISQTCLTAKTACIHGGGLIGLKAACALKKRGLEVKVIVKSPQVLSQVLDKESSGIFTEHLSSCGIEILTGADVYEFIGNGELKAVKLDSGKVIASSLAIIGKGVKPNIGILEGSGINCDEGVLCDEYMATNIPDIYAAGDVAQAYDPVAEKKVVNALWPNAVEQAVIAASSILGGKIKYAGGVAMNSVEFFGLPVISFGHTRANEQGYEELGFLNRAKNIYRKIIIKDNRIKGAIFMNKIDNIGILLKLAMQKVDISAIKSQILRPDFNFSFVKDLKYDKEEFYFK